MQILTDRHDAERGASLARARQTPPVRTLRCRSMKKTRLLVCIALTAVLVTAVTLAVTLTARAERRAAEGQAAVYHEYQQLLERAASYAVTVSENGAAVGTYTLADLGVFEGTRAAIDALYTDTERLSPEAFAARPLREKLAWHDVSHPTDCAAAVPVEGFDAEVVLRDLRAVPREAAQDAYLSFSDGAYHIHPEVPGTILREDEVRSALRQFVAGLSLTADTADAAFELTDCACYVPPEVTVENAGFDFKAALAESVSDLRVTVDFHGQTETLEKEPLAALLSVDGDGRLLVDGAALEHLISGWAETYNAYGTPYLFASYAGGVVPIDFLKCDYEVDTAALLGALEAQLLTLESGTVAAPYFCHRNGAPFAVETTYVEVDIKNQQLTYYKDGELVVNTDIVTGKLAGHRTPTGLYSSYDKKVNRWLVGEDYCVFVKYWVRITGAYGLHDASWRTKFGGEYYKYGGSHGCVNIPEEAMAKIYENIVDGTPILIH